MTAFNCVFDLLDRWRHLPDYQLERRTDIYFAMHLVPFLSDRFGIGLCTDIVPEFPVRIGTINPASNSNHSKKIDYLVLSSDLRRCFMVELKTDKASRCDTQDDYLLDARRVGLSALLRGITQIFQATKATRKYYRLLCLLEEIGLILIPHELHTAIRTRDCRPPAALVEAITLPPLQTQSEIVYIQPHACQPNEVSFAEFARWLPVGRDPLTDRFRQSLLRWAAEPAGRPGCDHAVRS